MLPIPTPTTNVDLFALGWYYDYVTATKPHLSIMALINTAFITLDASGNLPLAQALERLQPCPTLQHLIIVARDGTQAQTRAELTAAMRQAGQELVGVTLAGRNWCNAHDPIASALAITRQLGADTVLQIGDQRLPLHPHDNVKKAMLRYTLLLNQVR